MIAKKKRRTQKRHEEIYELHDEEILNEESRTVYLVGDIDEELIRVTTERMVYLSEKNPKKPIHLIINTFGGEVDDTFMLYDLMKYVPTPIHTVGLGKIMSAGCLLLAAGTKGERKIGKNARIMYHCGWDNIGGTLFEMKSSLEAFEKQENQYDRRFSEETGLSLAEVEKLYNKHGPTADAYISAEEAIKLGICDSLI